MVLARFAEAITLRVRMLRDQVRFMCCGKVGTRTYAKYKAPKGRMMSVSTEEPPISQKQVKGRTISHDKRHDVPPPRAYGVATPLPEGLEQRQGEDRAVEEEE